MRELVIKFYKLGIYTDENLPVFVRVQWISKADYKDLTGNDYDVAQQMVKSCITFKKEVTCQNY